MTDPAVPSVLSAVLGWSNPTTGPRSTRLYAADVPNPRWAGPDGRVVEQALEEAGGHEGERYLIVRVGDRFTPDETVEAVAQAIRDLTLTEPFKPRPMRGGYPG